MVKAKLELLNHRLVSIKHVKEFNDYNQKVFSINNVRWRAFRPWCRLGTRKFANESPECSIDLAAFAAIVAALAAASCNTLPVFSALPWRLGSCSVAALSAEPGLSFATCCPLSLFAVICWSGFGTPDARVALF